MSRYRTPLRYPGGKQRLAPFILELIVKNQLVGGHYVEPYAGGAGVGIELLLSRHVSHIHLNDSSPQIYAFWNSILTQPDEFCKRISSASLTVEEWKRQREIVRHPGSYNEMEVGFSTFYLNRCNRSGVLSGGLIGELEQKGEWKMNARFSRNELIRRIEAVSNRATAITLRNWDAERFILEHIPTLPQETFVYCDPPYFEKASSLYLNHYGKADHARIARIIQEQLARKWAVSYDNAAEILSYYSERRSFLYDLQYNAAHVYKGKEIFIFADDTKLPNELSLSYINQALKNTGEMEPQLVFNDL